MNREKARKMRRVLLIALAVLMLVIIWFGIGFWTFIQEENAELRSFQQETKRNKSGLAQRDSDKLATINSEKIEC
jgi:cytoskeletal protein RodZ